MGKFEHNGRLAVAALLALVASVLLLASVAAATPGIQNPSQAPSGEVFEGTSDGQIEVWERFAFGLRTDDTGAATQVPYPADVIGATGFGEKSLVATFGLNRNPAGTHIAGNSVPVTFDDGRANSGDLSGQARVDVVAARITGSGDGFPNSASNTIDLLSDVDNANENASFEMVENGVSLDPNGELSTSFTPSQSGQYVLLLASHEAGSNGFETGASDPSLGIANDNISVDGDIVILGTDQLSVQAQQNSVSVADTTVGSTLNFNIDASTAFVGSPDVTHVVALYDRDRFENSRFELKVDETALGPNFDLSSDSTLNHSIRNVTGVADVENGIAINGEELADGRVARTVGAGQAVDFIVEDITGDPPATNAIRRGGESNTEFETLDASVTGVTNASPTATVSVETFSNFTTGDYRYVVYTMRDDDSSVTSTATGTVSLAAASTGGGGGSGGGGGGGGGSGGGVDDPVSPNETETPTETATPGSGGGFTTTTAAPGTESDTETETAAPSTESDTETAGETETESPTTTETSGPGFGISLAIVAVLAATLFARRRD